MKILPFWIPRLFFCSLLLILVGCRVGQVQVVAEGDEPSYRRGLSLLREGRNNEALAAFLKVIEKRSDAAESHLETGRIYLEHLRDPIAAIHHFRRFLELRPQTDRTVVVRQLIETAQKEFARSLPGGPAMGEFDRLDWMDKVSELQAENLELKRQLAAVQRQLQEAGGASRRAAETAANGRAPAPFTPVVPTANTSPERAEARPTRYVVEGGDTLSRISTKVYGTPGRWMDIFQANRDQLPSPHALRVGQELKIP